MKPLINFLEVSRSGRVYFVLRKCLAPAPVALFSLLKLRRSPHNSGDSATFSTVSSGRSRRPAPLRFQGECQCGYDKNKEKLREMFGQPSSVCSAIASLEAPAVGAGEGMAVVSFVTSPRFENKHDHIRGRVEDSFKWVINLKWRRAASSESWSWGEEGA